LDNQEDEDEEDGCSSIILPSQF